MALVEVPREISAHILEFCRQSGLEAPPVFVPIRPDLDCIPLECFHNVRRKVEKCGGRIQFGWAIWEWPGVFVEAEHHAVYETPSGPPWLDITPPGDTQDVRRLFLPDDSVKYDFSNEGIRIDNIRMALVADENILKFFHLAKRKMEIMNSVPGVGEITLDGVIASEYKWVIQEQAKLQYILAMKYTARNARCFCESGKKFKHCHGALVRGAG